MVKGKTRPSENELLSTPLRQVGRVATFAEGDMVSNIQVDTSFKPITSSGDIGLASPNGKLPCSSWNGRPVRRFWR